MGCGQTKIDVGLRKKVVVLGGGYAGTTIAKQLDSHFNVTVVDRQNYSTHSIGALRGISNKDYAPMVLIPFDKLLRDGKVVQGDIKEIAGSYVILNTSQGEQRLDFDFLVVATGSSMTFPSRPVATDAREAIKELERCSADVVSAKKALIIGGGSVGVELAAEIKYAYPDKPVTLVHSSNTLCGSGLSEKFYTALHDKLTKLGVVVQLNERVTFPTEMEGNSYYRGKELSLQTASGKTLEADLIFRCTGTSQATAHLKYFASKGALDSAGRLKVNEHMQVEGHTHIFALGDCCNTAEFKQAYLAMKHAAVAADNIRALSAGKPPAKRYRPAAKQAMLVPVGAKDGLADVGGSSLPTFLVVMLKSKDLMAVRRWKDMGYREVTAATPDKAALTPFAAGNRDSVATAKILNLVYASQ